MFYIPDLNDFMIKIQADLAIPVIRWFLCLFTSSDFKKEVRILMINGRQCR